MFSKAFLRVAVSYKIVMMIALDHGILLCPDTFTDAVQATQLKTMVWTPCLRSYDVVA